MANESGADWRIEIGDGEVEEEFDPIGGEKGFDWQRSSAEIDESTKDDGDYGSTSYGRQKVTFKVNGNLRLPDPGLQRASTVSKSRPPETNIRIVRGAIVKYAGRVAIGNFSSSHPDEGPVTYTFDMANKGVPTVDNLGATS